LKHEEILHRRKVIAGRLFEKSVIIYSNQDYLFNLEKKYLRLHLLIVRV
jgi:hypothetical protein